MIFKGKNILLLLPVIGIMLFVVLYIVATIYYPGGSQADMQSVGFSWMNNYWCNLLNENAINREVNSAKPVAFTAMFVLCLSFVVFWSVFPRYYIERKLLRRVVSISGVLGILISVFLFTQYHDLVINVACLFSMVAIIGIMMEMWRKRDMGLFWWGVINIVLVGVNNYFYYTKGLIGYLPVVQKVTFVVFLGWVVVMDLRVIKARFGEKIK